HPAVYIMILPAMGVISELVATFKRRIPKTKNEKGYRIQSRSQRGKFSGRYRVSSAQRILITILELPANRISLRTILDGKIGFSCS
ncbi:hypothetical protein CH375_12590, partial [Leptospira ellisii]